MTSVSVSQDFILPGSGDQDLSDSNTTAEMQDEENLESLVRRRSIALSLFESPSKHSKL